MIPVVDMQTFTNIYLRKDEVGHVNSWEYFFEQPAGIRLDEALATNDFEIEYVPKFSLYSLNSQGWDIFYNNGSRTIGGKYIGNISDLRLRFSRDWKS